MPPEWAENILIKRSPGSYIVRQSDKDPDELLLSYVSPRGIKHVIVPEFQDSVFIKSKRIKKRLNDESIGVEKFLKSFDCKDPVHLDYEAQPSSFKKKTGPEDVALHRCSVCKYESEDLKKAQKHRNLHRAGLCSKCDRYFPQHGLSYHSKKCGDVKLHYCDHEKKCDFSSPHKWIVAIHVKEVHCKAHPCPDPDCGKSFKSQELLQRHLKIHQPGPRERCTQCDLTFNNKMAKYRHMNKVHINPTIKISTGFFRLASGQSLSDRYKQRGKKYHFCQHCPYKTSNKSHFQNHQRIHLDSAKKVRPDLYKCVTTCTYQNKWRCKVKNHMKTCHKYLLTTDHYRPKGMMTNERICLLADRVDVSNRKMELIMKEVSDCVGKELLDTNIRAALSERLNTTAEFFYSKQIKFVNKKGDERFTAFVCMKDLKARIEEIVQRRGILNALVVLSLDGGADKILSTMAVFDLDNVDERTDTGFSVGGRKQIFLVAAAANVPENRAMVKMFFSEMKIKTLDMPFMLLGDEKMKNLMFGKLEEIIKIFVA